MIEPDFPSSVEPAARAYSYARSHRILEILGLGFGSTLLVVNLFFALQGLPIRSFGAVLAYCFAGMCLADFISGIVHWAADTYGHPRMPIFGGFVRTFREHHVDPLDITRHDTIETNGDVFIFSSPVHVMLLSWVRSPNALALIFGVFIMSYCNSQIHKWAHEACPPSWVRALQRSRFFLSPDHHARHHAGTHETHYCITTGWINAALDKTGFFRRVETALDKIGIRRTN